MLFRSGPSDILGWCDGFWLDGVIDGTSLGPSDMLGWCDGIWLDGVIDGTSLGPSDMLGWRDGIWLDRVIDGTSLGPSDGTFETVVCGSSEGTELEYVGMELGVRLCEMEGLRLGA